VKSEDIMNASLLPDLKGEEEDLKDGWDCIEIQ
jgi:hypothetical protein